MLRVANFQTSHLTLRQLTIHTGSKLLQENCFCNKALKAFRENVLLIAYNVTYGKNNVQEKLIDKLHAQFVHLARLETKLRVSCTRRLYT